MDTQKIDVLAVMGRLTDLALNSGGRRGEDETDNEPAIKLYEDATNARAAVAELIEDMRRIKECARLGIRYHAIGPGYVEEVAGISDAALARIGGAA